ncbi:MAG: hypothetical protein IKS59_05420 [Aeriscardovia sp.]|nr:hypothetical protein [Aeriscardovia sp.]
MDVEKNSTNQDTRNLGEETQLLKLVANENLNKPLTDEPKTTVFHMDDENHDTAAETMVEAPITRNSNSDPLATHVMQLTDNQSPVHDSETSAAETAYMRPLSDDDIKSFDAEKNSNENDDGAETMYFGHPFTTGQYDSEDTGEYVMYPEYGDTYSDDLYDYADDIMPADDASYTMPYNDYLPEQGYDFENSAVEPYNLQDAESTQLQHPLIENNTPAVLSESTALPTVAGITPIDSSNIPTPQAKKSHKKWWIWVLIVLIIVGLGYFGWNIWSKKSKTAALKSCQSAATALTTANNNVENAIKNAQSAASLSSVDVLDTSLLASLQKSINIPISMVLTCPASESAETLHSNATTMNNDVTQMNNLAAKIQSEASSVQSSQQAKSLSVARNKLTAEISTANQVLSSDTGKVANSSTIQALQQAISEAQSVANNSSATLEQITSSQTTLQQMIVSVKVSAQQLEEQQAAAAQAAEQAQQQNSTNSNSNSNTTDTNSGKSTSQSTIKQNSSNQSSTDKTTNNSSQSNSSTQTKKDEK